MVINTGLYIEEVWVVQMNSHVLMRNRKILPKQAKKYVRYGLNLKKVSKVFKIETKHCIWILKTV